VTAELRDVDLGDVLPGAEEFLIAGGRVKPVLFFLMRTLDPPHRRSDALVRHKTVVVGRQWVDDMHRPGPLLGWHRLRASVPALTVDFQQIGFQQGDRTTIVAPRDGVDPDGDHFEGRSETFDLRDYSLRVVSEWLAGPKNLALVSARVMTVAIYCLPEIYDQVPVGAEIFHEVGKRGF